MRVKTSLRYKEPGLRGGAYLPDPHDHRGSAMPIVSQFIDLLLRPMTLLTDPRSFVLAALVSSVASFVAYRAARSRSARRLSWTNAVLLGAPALWLVAAGLEILFVLPGLTGDSIRADLVLLSPVVWLLVIAQAVAVVRCLRLR